MSSATLARMFCIASLISLASPLACMQQEKFTEKLNKYADQLPFLCYYKRRFKDQIDPSLYVQTLDFHNSNKQVNNLLKTIKNTQKGKLKKGLKGLIISEVRMGKRYRDNKFSTFDKKTYFQISDENLTKLLDEEKNFDLETKDQKSIDETTVDKLSNSRPIANGIRSYYNLIDTSKAFFKNILHDPNSVKKKNELTKLIKNELIFTQQFLLLNKYLTTKKAAKIENLKDLITKYKKIPNQIDQTDKLSEPLIKSSEFLSKNFANVNWIPVIDEGEKTLKHIDPNGKLYEGESNIEEEMSILLKKITKFKQLEVSNLESSALNEGSCEHVVKRYCNLNKLSLEWLKKVLDSLKSINDKTELIKLQKLVKSEFLLLDKLISINESFTKKLLLVSTQLNDVATKFKDSQEQEMLEFSLFSSLNRFSILEGLEINKLNWKNTIEMREKILETIELKLKNLDETSSLIDSLFAIKDSCTVS